MVCQICGKKISVGNNVSHSHRKTKRLWSPNIQSAIIFVEGKKKKIKACTKCIKALNK